MLDIPRDIQLEIIARLTVGQRPAVRALGRLAGTCKCFHVLINDYIDRHVDPREKLRRLRIRALRNNNPLAGILEITSAKNACSQIVVSKYYTYDLMKALPHSWKNHIQYLTCNSNITIDMLLEWPACMDKKIRYILTEDSAITAGELRRHGLHCYVLEETLLDPISELDTISNIYGDAAYMHVLLDERFSAKFVYKLRKRWGITEFLADEIPKFCKDPSGVGPKYEKLLIEHGAIFIDARIPDFIGKYFSVITIMDNIASLRHDSIIWHSASSRVPNEIPLKFVLDNMELDWSWERFQLATVPSCRLHSDRLLECLEYHNAIMQGDISILHKILNKCKHGAITINWPVLACCKQIGINKLLKCGPINDCEFMSALSTRRDISRKLLLKYRKYWDIPVLIDTLNLLDSNS